MGKDRILGSMATITVNGPNGPVPCGEFDKFTAKQKSELKERKPLGQIKPHGQVSYGGWEMDFEGGKIDSALANVVATINGDLLNGKPAPKFTVVQTIKRYDGAVERYKYPDASLYGFEQSIDKADDEIKEKIKGWAAERTAI